MTKKKQSELYLQLMNTDKERTKLQRDEGGKGYTKLIH